MASTNRVQVILSPESLEHLKILAETKRRSVSGMSSVIIEDYLERKLPELQDNARYLAAKKRIDSKQIRDACHGIPKHKLEAIAEILEKE